MTATDGGDDDDDYQHWPDDEQYLQQTAVAAPGYDSHNGLRSHIYEPAPQKPPSPAAPKVQPYPQPQLIYAYPQPQMMAYPPSQYTYGPQGPVAYPAPAYYGYQQPGMPQPMPMPQYPVYQPAYTAPAKAPEKPKALKPTKWKGRTKAEVEEDDMKIAARDGAYDKRKVVPVGMKDDQMMWVVETDGSHTLRTFVAIKELKGEWKKDPRYEDAYYFVREEEKKD